MKIISKSLDLFLVMASALIMVALALSTQTAARIITIPLVLILPGYALTTALFPRRSLGVPESLAFALSLSLTVAILGGFALNLLPAGLNTFSWAIFSGGFTLIACMIGLIRRSQPRIISLDVAPARPRAVGITVWQTLSLVLAAVVVSAAIVLSIVGAMQQPRPGFTQLWLLPNTGKQPNTFVRLGMSNKEATDMNYRLTVDMNGKVIKTWSSIALKPDMQWNTTLTFDQASLARATKVEAILYRNDAPTQVYRHVVIWLNP